MDGPTLDSRPAGGRRSVEGMWMLPVVRSRLRCAGVRGRVEEPVLEQPERTVVGVAEALAGRDHLVEHGFEPCGPSDGPQDAADRALLRTKVFELASELCVVGATPAMRAA